jgi:hypothetical protein
LTRFLFALVICILERKMDTRDQILLDKQMRRLIPERHDGVLAMVVAFMFLIGLTSGIELAHNGGSEQIASNNAVMALAIADTTSPVVGR